MSSFNDDFAQFNKMLNEETDSSKVKKHYLALIKKYHPDNAPSEEKKLYTEYSILLNNSFSSWEALSLKSGHEKNVITEYKFTPKSKFLSNSRRISRTYTDYYEYLLNIGKDYYWRAHDAIEDKQNINKSSRTILIESLYYLSKAKRCYLEVLKHDCSDEEYRFMVQNEINKVKSMAKNISRTLMK